MSAAPLALAWRFAACDGARPKKSSAPAVQQVAAESPSQTWEGLSKVVLHSSSARRPARDPGLLPLIEVPAGPPLGSAALGGFAL